MIRMALSGVARGDDPGDIADRLTPFHPRNNTFPAEVLLELAADPIELAGARRDTRSSSNESASGICQRQ